MQNHPESIVFLVVMMMSIISESPRTWNRE